MEMKKLGKEGPLISRIGFGALAIGGFHYGKTNDEDSVKAVKKALDLGINFFDTADVYGFGKSEEILSKGLGEKRDKVIIATKVGVRWDENLKSSYYDLSPDHIFNSVNKSLSNLKIKKIPLYQMHYPDLSVPAKETMSALLKIKEEGKIQHIGCSNFTPELIEEYQNYGRIESIQVAYNLLDQKAEKDIFPICKKFNMGVIVYSPLAQGILTGKYRGIKFTEEDRRSKSKYFLPENQEKINILLEEMKKIGKRYNKTIGQVALRWILENDNVTCAIVGSKTQEEIEEASGASDWELKEEEIKELKRLGNIF